MLLRILSESFLRRKRRKLLGILSIALGSSLATALIGISIEVGDKMTQEMKVYGCNIIVRPQTFVSTDMAPLAKLEWLDESFLVKIKEIFWANNIIGFVPFLSTWATCDGHRIFIKGTFFSKKISLDQGRIWETGARRLFPYWKIEGSWPGESDSQEGVLIGKNLAGLLGVKIGQRISLNQKDRSLEVKVAGILNSGEEYDSEIILGLEQAQYLANLPQKVSFVLVSALTVPENELEKTYHRNPHTLSPEEYERWACTPYVSTVVSQIQDVIPHSVAEPVLEVAEREGRLLEKLKVLFLFICGVALLTSGIGLTSTLMATVVERRQEVGLLRALGAGSSDIILIFLAELTMIALLGSILGGGLGYGLGQLISLRIFQTTVHANMVVIFVVGGVTLLISVLGGLFPIRSALRVDPIKVLHEN